MSGSVLPPPLEKGDRGGFSAHAADHLFTGGRSAPTFGEAGIRPPPLTKTVGLPAGGRGIEGDSPLLPVGTTLSYPRRRYVGRDLTAAKTERKLGQCQAAGAD